MPLQPQWGSRSIAVLARGTSLRPDASCEVLRAVPSKCPGRGGKPGRHGTSTKPCTLHHVHPRRGPRRWHKREVSQLCVFSAFAIAMFVCRPRMLTSACSRRELAMQGFKSSSIAVGVRVGGDQLPATWHKNRTLHVSGLDLEP